MKLLPRSLCVPALPALCWLLAGATSAEAQQFPITRPTPVIQFTPNFIGGPGQMNFQVGGFQGNIPFGLTGGFGGGAGFAGGGQQGFGGFQGFGGGFQGFGGGQQGFGGGFQGFGGGFGGQF